MAVVMHAESSFSAAAAAAVLTSISPPARPPARARSAGLPGLSFNYAGLASSTGGAGGVYLAYMGMEPQVVRNQTVTLFLSF